MGHTLLHLTTHNSKTHAIMHIRPTSFAQITNSVGVVDIMATARITGRCGAE